MKGIPKIRRFWKRNPKTKVKESAKLYSRSKGKKKTRDITGEDLWREKKQKPEKK